VKQLSARKIKVIRTLPGLEIRFSEEADGEYWGRWLTEKAVLDWYPMEGPQERAESVARMQSWCKYRSALTGVYKGEIAGIAYLNLHPYRKIAHQALFTIIVSEKFRGLGIGKNLLEHLERLAKESFGVEILYLEVYEGNPAIRLYRRLGYEEFGFQSHWIREQPGEYRGKILMAKEL
jgi:putative acetyltransferase